MYCYLNLNHAVGVEIGCSMGESTEIAAQFFDKLYCVDSWEGPPAEEECFNRRALILPNVVKIKARSPEVTGPFSDGFFDVVYIDADHRYDAVMADIAAWAPKVKVGGWVTGHDYGSYWGPDTDNGVAAAVDAVYGKPDKVFEDSSWVVRKA